MVRAILDGRKTQTRRVVKPQPATVERWMAGKPAPQKTVISCTVFRNLAGSGWTNCYPFKCPYGQPGDRLWVRETWKANGTGGGPRITFKADGAEEWRKDAPNDSPMWIADDDNWRPSIFMPRWASRIALEITEVRAERLNEISDEDAIAEGVFFKDYGRACGHWGQWQDAGDCPAAPETHPQRPGWSWKETRSPFECLGSPRFAYFNLWDSIHGKDSWAANPYVWVIEFRRVK
jgi:hypothetical protein